MPRQIVIPLLIESPPSKGVWPPSGSRPLHSVPVTELVSVNAPRLDPDHALRETSAMTEHTTTEPPEEGMSYHFASYFRIEGRLPLLYHRESQRWPWRGDWHAARRRNPTLKRSVEGEPIDLQNWASNGWMEPERIKPLPAADLFDLAKRRAGLLDAKPIECGSCTQAGEPCTTCGGTGTLFQAPDRTYTAVDVCLAWGDQYPEE